MLNRLFSLALVACVPFVTGCQSGNTSSVAEVPPPSSSTAITASPDFAAGPQPVALKSNTPTAYGYGAYPATDTFAVGGPAPGAVAGPGASAAPLGGGNYVVRQGDTLWSISHARYGTGQRWKDIIAANPGLSAERLPVGRAIVLP